MRFLGYTLADESTVPAVAAVTRAVREDGHVSWRRRSRRASSSPRAGSRRPPMGAKISPQGRGVHRRRRPVRRGEGDGRRVGAAWSAGTWARPSSGPSGFSGVLGEGEVRVRPVIGEHASSGTRRRPRPRPVVESVACRLPIRPPRSRRCSAWSSAGSWRRWPASSATSVWPRSWRRRPWSTPRQWPAKAHPAIPVRG